LKTYISILRGINVSGHRLIKMAALKSIFSSLGFSNVHTYIQSGNIVFRSTISNSKKLSSLIKAALQKEFGYDVPVITLTVEELEGIICSNPFAKNNTKDNSFFHITFLAEEPEQKNIETVQKVNEEYEIVDKAIYLYCPAGYSNSKLTNTFLERKLKTVATTRNWKTSLELLRIAKTTE
jgi:uncharacterized protein (DUF1697 family)